MFVLLSIDQKRNNDKLYTNKYVLSQSDMFEMDTEIILLNLNIWTDMIAHYPCKKYLLKCINLLSLQSTKIACPFWAFIIR